MKYVLLIVAILIGLYLYSNYKKGNETCIDGKCYPRKPIPGPPVKIYHTNYQEAVKAAKEGRRNLIIVFSTSGCHWCDKLKTETLSDDKVRSYISEKFVFLADNGNNKDLAQKYGVKGYPHTVVVDSTGKPLNQISGYVPPEKFISELRRAE